MRNNIGQFVKGNVSYMKGKKFSKEHRLKIGLSQIGKFVSKETRKRLSESHKGQIAWNRGIKTGIVPASGFKKGNKPPQHIDTCGCFRCDKKIGEKHQNWKGGITPINKAIRTSARYKLWRNAVYKRDNWTCVVGGKEHGSKLHADHIKPFATFPELRFDINNGRTLCADCHRKTDTWGGKGIKRIKIILNQ